MQIKKAELSDLEILAPLFDAYRVFYQQASDLNRALTFLKERLINQDSIIFLALDDAGKGMGFTQIYPTFGSIGTCRIYVLNDLYVAPEYRKQSVGCALMNAAKEHALQKGIARIKLSTAHSNTTAQKLYESLGYKQDQQFRTYDLVLI